MRPIPIHMTFNLGDRKYAVPCGCVERARELRDMTVDYPRMKHARINKGGRLHPEAVKISPEKMIRVLEKSGGR